MARNLICSECNGKLKRGFIFEPPGYFGFFVTSDATFWVEGKPEMNWLGNMKIQGKEKYYITAYRCERCGLIKLYAGPDNLKTTE